MIAGNWDALGFVDSQNEDEARKRFTANDFGRIDPFDKIPPALLNSADIFDYARVTAMIWPFASDKERLSRKLKSASYEIDFLGDLYRVDESGASHASTIEENKPYVLPKNSIVFVSLKTLFQLPDYIALRFNLKITHVHRGLLLGTGPLVDPGFRGRLLIPLHNLTSEDYTLLGGEGLIWVEFTKLSPNTRWNVDARTASIDFFPFPENKKDLSAQQYFNKSSSGTPASSSIPGEVRTAKRVSERTQVQLRRLAWGGIASIVIAILGLLLPTWSLIQEANKNVADSSKNMSDYRKSVTDLEDKVAKLSDELRAMKAAAAAAPTVPPKAPAKR
jgi:deoxycytidine triphosphate deaminase